MNGTTGCHSWQAWPDICTTFVYDTLTGYGCITMDEDRHCLSQVAVVFVINPGRAVTNQRIKPLGCDRVRRQLPINFLPDGVLMWLECPRWCTSPSPSPIVRSDSLPSNSCKKICSYVFQECYTFRRLRCAIPITTSLTSISADYYWYRVKRRNGILSARR